jgi:hypothetical protein
MNVVALNHGSTGLISWDEDHNTPLNLIASAATIGSVLPDITSAIFAPGVIRKRYTSTTLDFGYWYLSKDGRTRSLVLGASAHNIDFNQISGKLPGNATVTKLFNTEGVSLLTQDNNNLIVEFNELGSIGFIVDY